jgi:acetyl esterase/lipase
MKKSKIYLMPLLFIFCISQASCAMPIRMALKEHKKSQQESSDLEAGESSNETAAMPNNIKILRDIPFGDHNLQRMDVYLPANGIKNAPVIFMVHGGAWKIGDKAMSRVIQNKTARWVPQGFIFISTNYRMLPDTDILLQAEDVARALALAQSKATSWGGDASKFIIMGHSAGAHLVAMLGANPAKAYSVGAKPWLGTVSLDSAALDLVKIMERRHPRLYDQAFGSDPAYWRANSPVHVITSSATPLLAVCSTQRADNPCVNAQDYANKATALGIQTKILQQNLSHSQINENLGKPGAYTDAVEEFMGSLDKTVNEMLKKH